MTLPPEDHRLQPDHAPTPFSAAQIRDGCPAGRTIRVRREAPGDTPTDRVIRFVEVDAYGAVQEFQPADPEDRPVGEAAKRRSSWLELQSHASQPAVATAIDEVDLSLPFGVEACWRYTVMNEEGSTIFWFAKRLPGMPVQVEEWIGEARVSRTVMVANSFGGA